MRPGEGKAEARGGLLIKISEETGNADSESGRMCLCERYRYKEDSRVTRTQREISFHPSKGTTDTHNRGFIYTKERFGELYLGKPEFMQVKVSLRLKLSLNQEGGTYCNSCWHKQSQYSMSG